MIAIHCGALFHAPEGTKQHHELRAAFTLDKCDGIDITAPVTAHVQLLKLPHEINVQVTDLHTMAQAICTRCLKKFLLEINIPFFEREFIIDLDKRNLELGEEIFYIDREKNQIIMDEMIREEILLHFPTISLCSEGCKGLCDKCSRNLNEGVCACQRKENERVLPFKRLVS